MYPTERILTLLFVSTIFLLIDNTQAKHNYKCLGDLLQRYGELCNRGDFKECVYRVFRTYSNEYFKSMNTKDRLSYCYVFAYFEFIGSNLIPGKILSANDFCHQKIKENEDYYACQTEIKSTHGLTLETPAEILSDIFYNKIMFGVYYESFTHRYMKHILENITFKDGIKTTREFCNETEI